MSFKEALVFTPAEEWRAVAILSLSIVALCFFRCLAVTSQTPADCVSRRAAERMRRKTTKLHKMQEEKASNQSQQCLMTGDGMDPDAREGLPPLTHEENQSVLCLLVLPLASGNNVNLKKQL